MKNYYNILKVNREASQADIENAYRNRLSVLNSDELINENNYIQIKEAYEVLGDIDKRKVYDVLFLAYNQDKPFEEMYSAISYGINDKKDKIMKNSNNLLIEFFHFIDKHPLWTFAIFLLISYFFIFLMR